MTETAVQSPTDRNEFVRTDHLQADLKGRSVRGAAATMLGQGVKFVTMAAGTMVLARLLTPADFGLVAMVTAMTGFIALFKDLGLSMATIQRAEISHEQISTLFWVNTAISLVIALTTAALAPVIAWFYGEPRLAPITVTLSLAFLFGGLTVQHQALLRRQMRFGSLAVIQILSLLAGEAAAIVAAAMSAGYWALVVLHLTMPAVDMICVWVLVRWLPSLPSRGAGVREMLRFGANLTGFNVLNYFTRNADSVIAGYALGSAALGYYSKAYGLLMLPLSQINTPLTSVMVPTLSRLQSAPDRYRRYYLQVLAAIAALTMPVVALLFVTADDVVRIILGSQWTPAIAVFRLLAPAAFFGSINFAPGWLCISLGRPGIQLRWALVSAPITVLGFLVGVNWGVDGVGAAFSATWCALFTLFVYWATRRSPVCFCDIIKTLVVPVFGSFLASLGAALTGRFVSESSTILRFAVCGLAFAGCYFGCLMATSVGRQLAKSIIIALPALRGEAKTATIVG